MFGSVTPAHRRTAGVVGILVTVTLGLAALAAPAGASSHRLVRYSGQAGVVYRHSGMLHRLAATNPAFRRFVHHRLNVLWRETGGRTRCAHSPVVQVQAWRSDGYARFSENVAAHGGDPASCSAGGYEALGTVVSGRWREVVGTQEEFHCSLLRTYGFPADVAGHRCLTKSGRSVRYP